MPTLRNIFKKTKSTTKDKVSSTVNNALDTELTNYAFIINWIYAIIFGIFTLTFTATYIASKLFKVKLLLSDNALLLLIGIIISTPIFIYYFQHAKNKTQSKGKILVLIIWVILNIIGMILN